MNKVSLALAACLMLSATAAQAHLPEPCDQHVGKMADTLDEALALIKEARVAAREYEADYREVLATQSQALMVERLTRIAEKDLPYVLNLFRQYMNTTIEYMQVSADAVGCAKGGAP